MNEAAFQELVHRASEQVMVSPTPTTHLLLEAKRSQRRRRAAAAILGTSVAAALVVLGGVALWPAGGVDVARNATAQPVDASTHDSGSVDACPPVEERFILPPLPTPQIPFPPGVDAEDVSKQQLLERALAPMWSVTKESGSPDSGYARSSVDHEDMTAEIMWKGDPPAVVKQLEGTNKDGVCVTIVSVPYSAWEAIAAGGRIFAAVPESAWPSAAYANEAFDGLIVEFVAEDLDGVDREKLGDQLEAMAGMPVTIAEGERAVEADLRRGDLRRGEQSDK
jgi:hypothetical protein